MSRADDIARLLSIADFNQFGVDFYDYLTDKPSSRNEFEEAAYLTLSMLLDIEMEGFADLFYQLYSLRECEIVEQLLRQLKFNKLADLFSEAKMIYIRGNQNITQEEYENLEPFSLSEPYSSRFDEIGRMILAEDSEIYAIGKSIYQYIKENPATLQNTNSNS